MSIKELISDLHLENGSEEPIPLATENFPRMNLYFSIENPLMKTMFHAMINVSRSNYNILS